jgi:hypothetical protein
MTIIPPEIVQQVLYVAFAVYNFLGFLLFIMGIVYQADVGSIGTAGTYCILTGLMFLVVGSVAIYATHASNWKLLFIVEMFNVALFMVSDAESPPRLDIRLLLQPLPLRPQQWLTPVCCHSSATT